MMDGHLGKSIRMMALAVLLSTGLAGCATAPGGNAATGGIADPLQGFNKAVFKFNDVADQNLIRPVTVGYRDYVPHGIRMGLRNFLNNLRAPVNLANNLLQGDLTGAGVTTERTMINTLIGVGGVFDVAASEGIPYRQEDFGQTLGVWGFGHGAYLVLPLIGPSSIRDGSGMIVDGLMDPLNWYLRNTDNEGWVWARYGAEYLDTRESLLDALDDLRRNSFDYYTAVRSAYVQTRAAEVANQKDPNMSAASSVQIPNYGKGQK